MIGNLHRRLANHTHNTDNTVYVMKTIMSSDTQFIVMKEPVKVLGVRIKTCVGRSNSVDAFPPVA